ncbi:hypothetical protein [Clostridium frigidicarnis]|uniref:Tetratricopeptide repeat-containing protein n=1 Tax=Clostridium frigidicarnis TaxID=84698 RepID=A0A1I0YDH6_9CLOT|nr:hypothetical protein [Clostridium frigidicarnis]SFB11212.1 hypothetical protein SAMN04488528_1012101 [Clostridium frigidicarnis]
MRSKKVILAIIIVVIAIIGGTIGFKVYEKEQKIKDLVSNSDKLLQEEKYEEAKSCLEEAKNIKNKDGLDNKIDTANIYIEANNVYREALKLIDNKEYNKAIEELNKINDKAEIIKTKANNNILDCNKKLVNQYLSQGEQYLNQKDFDKAYECVDEAKKVEDKNEDIEVLKNKIDNDKKVFEEEQKAAKESEEKQLSLEEAKSLAVKVYAKGTNRRVIVECDDETQKDLQGMTGYTIHLLDNMGTHTATIGYYFVDINSGKVYSTLVGAPPLTLLN